MGEIVKIGRLLMVLTSLAFASGCEKKVEGLSAAWSDEKILRELGLNPDDLKVEEAQGADGFSMIYRDASNEVWITRSVVSGVIVMRMKPESSQKIWELGEP